MVDKLIVVPFVVVFVIIASLVGALAYYAPTPGGAVPTVHTSTLTIKNAVLDDVTLGEAAPCSTTGLTISCVPSFALGSGNRVTVTFNIQNKGNSSALIFGGGSGFQAYRWTIPKGSIVHSLNGTIPLTSPQASLFLNFSAS